jgi:hypothetical protein
MNQWHQADAPRGMPREEYGDLLEAGRGLNATAERCLLDVCERFSWKRRQSSWAMPTMEIEEWATLIEAARSQPPMVVKALTYRRAWNSACRAVQVSCDDGSDYVVKGSQVGRSAFNDQVVGRIALQLV